MPAVFPLVALPYWLWVRDLGEHMLEEGRPRCCGTCEHFKDDEAFTCKRHRSYKLRGELCASYCGTGKINASTRDGRKFCNGIARRSSEIQSCVTHVKGHYCETCGRPAEKNGQLHGARGRNLCHARSCPRCARRRSAALKAWGDVLRGNIDTMSSWCTEHHIEHRLRLVTLTDTYDPSDPADLTVAALRDRWNGLRAAFRAILEHERFRVKNRGIWDTVTNAAGEVRCVKNPVRVAERKHEASLIGAWSCVELSGTGHAHLHVLYFGPWVSLDPVSGPGVHGTPGWKAIGRAAYPKLGDVADVELADVDAIAEIVKYPLKAPGASNKSADWLAGEALLNKAGRPGLMHPHLAARWEIALYGARIGDRYGSFRQIPGPDEVAVSDKSTRPERPCRFCGGDIWKLASWPVADWIKFCRRAGVEPLGNPSGRMKGNHHGKETGQKSEVFEGRSGGDVHEQAREAAYATASASADDAATGEARETAWLSEQAEG